MLAVLLAALLHAIWNSLAHAAWPYIIASATVHVFYNLLLLASYQLGEFSQMYPLARGTSPWLVAVVALVVLGHEMPVTELAGVLTISAGLIALVFVGGRPTRKDLPALGAATLTGVMIAGYTVIDGVGVQQGPLLAYTGWMFLLQGPPLAIFAAIRRGPRLLGAVRECAVPGLAGGRSRWPRTRSCWPRSAPVRSRRSPRCARPASCSAR